MADLMQFAGKAIAVILAVGAGFWYARIGMNWNIKLAGPLALSFVAFIVGSFAFGDPAAGDSFQLQVWFVMGGGVLAGVALSKLMPSSSSVSGGEQDAEKSCDKNDEGNK